MQELVKDTSVFNIEVSIVTKLLKQTKVNKSPGPDTTTIKRAQQPLHFLRVLRRNGVERKLLVVFYQATIESVPTYCITVWHAGCSAAGKNS